MPQSNRFSRRKLVAGFTLIELLIVMVIIGILATIGMGSYGTARMKARDAKRKNDLETITKSLEAYANDHRAYPSSTGGLITCEPPTTTCNWGAAFTDASGTIYTAKLPEDGSSDRAYYYDSDGTTFTLYAALENENDPAYDATLTQDCGNTTCNYRVSSSNNPN